MKDKYNYSLNGIEHEITLNHNLKIDQKPLNEKILVSNKYLMKYINDLFDYHSIEYIVVGNTLLGVYIFNGINIFNQTLELCTLENNFFKIRKIEDEIKKDDFDIIFNDNYIKISTVFFDNIKSTIYIYPLNNDQNEDSLNYITYNNQLINHPFYDIFPIKKTNFEEFNISIPNKIDKVLESYNFNLNYIVFSKKSKKDNKKIIEEVENKNTINAIKENINNFISVIKPFFFS
jgi:hypothetical protein